MRIFPELSRRVRAANEVCAVQGGRDTLSANIVTEEVRGRVVRTKYGRVQGFISRVGRDAEHARFVQIFLGVPYASPPTGNYRWTLVYTIQCEIQSVTLRIQEKTALYNFICFICEGYQWLWSPGSPRRGHRCTGRACSPPRGTARCARSSCPTRPTPRARCAPCPGDGSATCAASSAAWASRRRTASTSTSTSPTTRGRTPPSQARAEVSLLYYVTILFYCYISCQK